MRRLISTSLLVCLLMGCASARLTAIEPLREPVDRVSLAFEPSPGQMNDEQQSRLRSTLTTSLVDKRVRVVPSHTKDAHALAGKITLYQPGNRALRYFIGMGAGRGQFSSEWVVSASAGSQVGACRVDGSIAMGVFGGSYDDVLERVGNELADYLRGEDDSK